jgi:PKD repeat protein
MVLSAMVSLILLLVAISAGAPGANRPPTVRSFPQFSGSGGLSARNTPAVGAQFTGQAEESCSPTVGSYGSAGSERLALSSGSQEYLFEATTAGRPIPSESWTTDVAGPTYPYPPEWTNGTSVSIGHQANDTGSFNGTFSNLAIAGVAVNGFTNYSVVQSYANGSSSNGTLAGGTHLRLTFNVPLPTMVVVLVGASGTGSLNMTGIPLRTLVDQTYNEGGADTNASVAIYEGNLTPGIYSGNLTGTTDAATNSGTVIAAGAYVFCASTGVSLNSSNGPSIASVSFANGSAGFALVVTGQGFGSAPAPMPYTGDLPDFRIGDNAQLGSGEWGYTGDAKGLEYESWSATRIAVGGFGGSAGDAIELAVWNPTSQLGATWGGNVPGGRSDVPMIDSVRFSGSGENLAMTVSGFGFGNTPQSMPFTGDLNFFWFQDFANHCGAGSAKFEAGFGEWGIFSPNSVTLTYGSWSNAQVVIYGFSGGYGSGCANLDDGDPVAIGLWNTSDGGVIGSQTAWGGTIASMSLLSLSASAEPSVGVGPLTVSFHANVSGGVPPFSCMWSFGDGENGSGLAVLHTYVSGGAYLVTVEARDSEGDQAETTLTIGVSPSQTVTATGAIQVSISAGPASGPAPLNTNLSASVQGGKAPYTLTWDFGDGSPLANGSAVHHDYATSGIYAATLLVTDAAGNEATTGVFITASGSNETNIRPRVIVTAFELRGSAPFTVAFSPVATGGEQPYRLNWSFGDDSAVLIESGLVTVYHTYERPGTFAPQLVVTDSRGNSTTWSAGTPTLPTVVSVLGPSSGTTLALFAQIAIVVTIGVLIALFTMIVVRRRRPPAVPNVAPIETTAGRTRTPILPSAVGDPRNRKSPSSEPDPMGDMLQSWSPDRALSFPAASSPSGSEL